MPDLSPLSVPLQQEATTRPAQPRDHHSALSLPARGDHRQPAVSRRVSPWWPKFFLPVVNRVFDLVASGLRCVQRSDGILGLGVVRAKHADLLSSSLLRHTTQETPFPLHTVGNSDHLLSHLLHWCDGVSPLRKHIRLRGVLVWKLCVLRPHTMASLLGQPRQPNAVYTTRSCLQRLPCRAHDPSTIPSSTIRSLAKAAQDDHSTAIDFVLVINHNAARRSPDDHPENCTRHGEFRFDGGYVFLLLEFVRRVILATDLSGFIARPVAKVVHSCKATIPTDHWPDSNTGCESEDFNPTAVKDILPMISLKLVISSDPFDGRVSRFFFRLSSQDATLSVSFLMSMGSLTIQLMNVIIAFILVGSIAVGTLIGAPRR